LIKVLRLHEVKFKYSVPKSHNGTCKLRHCLERKKTDISQNIFYVAQKKEMFGKKTSNDDRTFG